MRITLTLLQCSSSPSTLQANAKLVGESKIVERDPVRDMLYQWEIEYRKREQAKANGQGR